MQKSVIFGTPKKWPFFQCSKSQILNPEKTREKSLFSLFLKNGHFWAIFFAFFCVFSPFFEKWQKWSKMMKIYKDTVNLVIFGPFFGPFFDPLFWPLFGTSRLISGVFLETSDFRGVKKCHFLVILHRELNSKSTHFGSILCHLLFGFYVESRPKIAKIGQKRG